MPAVLIMLFGSSSQCSANFVRPAPTIAAQGVLVNGNARMTRRLWANKKLFQWTQESDAQRIFVANLPPAQTDKDGQDPMLEGGGFLINFVFAVADYPFGAQSKMD
jgi:hypothetical protein